MFDLAHMSETKTPGQQVYKQQLRETVRPVAVPMSLNCSVTAGMFVTVAPGHLAH